MFVVEEQLYVSSTSIHHHEHQPAAGVLAQLGKLIDQLLPHSNKELNDSQTSLHQENENLHEEMKRRNHELQQMKIQLAAIKKNEQECKEESVKLRLEIYQLRVQLRSLQHTQLQQLITLSQLRNWKPRIMN